MLNIYLPLLAVAFSTLVAASPTTYPSKFVYNNCSGDYPHSLPTTQSGINYYKPQIANDPNHVKKGSSGWEEWQALALTHLDDGTNAVFNLRWNFGDPGSANLSDSTFSAWTNTGNGTTYHRSAKGSFSYKDNADGGFTCAIANNTLTFDYVRQFWNVSVNFADFTANMYLPDTVPHHPFLPNYKGVPAQISNGLYSQMDARVHVDGGYMTFPTGTTRLTTSGVGSLKHIWSHKAMSKLASSYVRGTIFVPRLPIGTINYHQVWDNSDNEVDSMHFMFQPDGSSNTQEFRLQVVDQPKLVDVVTTPYPPTSFTSTEITFPLCGQGVNFDTTNKTMTWTATNPVTLFDDTDSAGGSIVYRQVNTSGVVWTNGTLYPFANGLGLVEIYNA